MAPAVRGAQAARFGDVEQLALPGAKLRICGLLHLPRRAKTRRFLKNTAPVNTSALLEQAPLWLDWQIEQARKGRIWPLRTSSRAGPFRPWWAHAGASFCPRAPLRSHYLQQVAERLSAQPASPRKLEERPGALQSEGRALAWPLGALGEARRWQPARRLPRA